MPNSLAIDFEPVKRREKDDFAGTERLCNFHGNQVGINTKGSPFAIESERGYDRHNLLVKEQLQNFRVDPFNFPGILIVHSVKNAERMRDHTVCVSGAEINLGKTFHDLVCQS